MEVTPTTVRIDKSTIHITVLVDQATGAATARQTPIEDNRTLIDNKDTEREETHSGDTLWKRRLSLMNYKNIQRMAYCVM